MISWDEERRGNFKSSVCGGICSYEPWISSSTNSAAWFIGREIKVKYRVVTHMEAVFIVEYRIDFCFFQIHITAEEHP